MLVVTWYLISRSWSRQRANYDWFLTISTSRSLPISSCKITEIQTCTRLDSLSHLIEFHLDDTSPLVVDINKLENMEYLLTNEELEKMKSDFLTLVMRVLVDVFLCLQHLKSKVVEHIPHK